MTTVPTIVQKEVFDKHNQLWGNIEERIAQKWREVRPHPPAGDTCMWNISTTKNSQIIILSVGVESMFTRNSYSSDKNNPWLITSGEIVNSNLKKEIISYWNGKLRDHTMHDKICPFMVFVDDKWNRKDLNVDDGCIRVQIEDITIWCHPPRFEVLQAVIDNTSKKEFWNEVGKFQKSAKLLQNVDSDPKIPENIKNKRKEKCAAKVRESFESVYSHFENLDWEDASKYTSYRYPTLQLEVNKIHPAEAQTEDDKMRYGGTFSGVYGPTANEVHNKFTVLGTEPVPMPTKEEIFDLLVGRIPNIDLQYNDVFNDDVPINVDTPQVGQP